MSCGFKWRSYLALKCCCFHRWKPLALSDFTRFQIIEVDIDLMSMLYKEPALRTK